MFDFIPTVSAEEPKFTSAVRPPDQDLGGLFGFGEIKSLGEGISFLIGPAMTIAGTIVLIYFIVAALQLVYSGGDKAKIQAARDRITYSIVGVVLLIVTFFVLPFVMKFFGVSIQIFK